MPEHRPQEAREEPCCDRAMEPMQPSENIDEGRGRFAGQAETKRVHVDGSCPSRISRVTSLAGAGGIEPPNGGIKISLNIQ
jgi:hypothetical protein